MGGDHPVTLQSLRFACNDVGVDIQAAVSAAVAAVAAAQASLGVAWAWGLPFVLRHTLQLE